MPLSLPEHVRGLRCILCESVSTDPWEWVCQSCGPESRMDVVYVEDACERLARGLRSERRLDMWRYREVLPLADDASALPLHYGWTPLVSAPRLAAAAGLARLVLKDEGRGPSASLKDRPSALGVRLALAAGAERIVCASTGNAASSTACAAAAAGLAATIFVPERAPLPKVAQLRVFGAEVVRVRADYDRTWDLCAEVAAQKAEGERPWFNRNCAVNPYLVEGKKTHALEVAEQLGDAMTDWLVLSVGDGCTIASAVKGLEEAHAAGLIPFVPRVLGVQAEGAAPVAKAYAAGKDDVEPLQADSIADSIAVGHPRNARKALSFVRRNRGDYVTVSDEEILAAEVDTARLGGVFAEPAAAAAAAGVKAAVKAGVIGAKESATVVVSGNGLKDTDAALKAAGGPLDAEPTIESVLSVLRA